MVKVFCVILKSAPNDVNSSIFYTGDKEKRGIDQQNRELKLKLLSNIDEVEDNLRNVKSVLAGKHEDNRNKLLQIEADVHQKILHIEASNLGKIGEVQSKIHQIEASNAEYRINLIRDIEEKNNKNIKNIEGMGERLMKRIDDRIDELIERQDKIFQEMISSREQQNNTVNTFKTEASDLIFKVNEVSEKITDFEKNKRNNLILFGVPNDPHETPTSLDAKVNIYGF